MLVSEDGREPIGRLDEGSYPFSEPLKENFAASLKLKDEPISLYAPAAGISS